MPTPDAPASSTSRRTDNRIRPEDQEKLLTARMSDEQRELVKEVAHNLGYSSVAAWILARAEADARRVSQFGRVGAATLSGDNSIQAEGPRRIDGAPHAKADLAAVTAVG